MVGAVCSTSQLNTVLLSLSSVLPMLQRDLHDLLQESTVSPVHLVTTNVMYREIEHLAPCDNYHTVLHIMCSLRE